MSVTERDPVVPLPVAALNEARFDELCHEAGADTEPERAALFDTDVRNVYRWRAGIAPRLPKALQVAHRLGTTVEDLWGDQQLSAAMQ